MKSNRNALASYEMVHSDTISDFIIELIRYAKDEDIRLFLKYIPNKTIVTSFPKTTLIENIFSPLYHSVQYSLNNLPVELTYKKEYTELPKNYDEYLIYDESYKYFYPLYLHLYALCESYYSYYTYSSEDKEHLIEQINYYEKIINRYQREYNISDEYKAILNDMLNELKEDYEKNIKVLTPKDKEKIISLLINCYNDNGFYYFFNKDELTKVEIQEIKKNNRNYYSYNYTEYDLVHTEDSTRIINKDLKIDCKIKKVPIYDEDNNISSNDNLEELFQTMLVENVIHADFQTIKSVHKDIIKVLAKPKQDFCRCCNPNPNAKKTPNLCEKCEMLINCLDYLSSQINDWDSSAYISDLKEKISKENIFSYILNQKQNDPNIKAKRKRKLKNITKTAMNKIETQLTKISADDIYKRKYYNNLQDILERVNLNIKNVFD